VDLCCGADCLGNSIYIAGVEGFVQKIDDFGPVWALTDLLVLDLVRHASHRLSGQMPTRVFTLSVAFQVRIFQPNRGISLTNGAALAFWTKCFGTMEADKELGISK
jgi:hypothetical protein